MNHFKINSEEITAIVNCQLSIANSPPIIAGRYKVRFTLPQKHLPPVPAPERRT